jgi:hypothetical protein
MGGLNIRMGATVGCAAIAGQETTFATVAQAIRVVAGRGETCRTTFQANLRRALDLTGGMTLTIRHAVPLWQTTTFRHARTFWE